MRRVRAALLLSLAVFVLHAAGAHAAVKKAGVAAAGSEGAAGSHKAASAPPGPAAASKAAASAASPGTAATPESALSAAPTPAREGVQWMEWGPEAFQKAIFRDRPILLNVVVPWSRTCRQMEATWASPRVARLVDEGFVPVRVDAERRPDIRDRYPSATWPAVSIVLPNGMPLYAAREGAKNPVRVTLGLLPPERLAPILEEALATFKDKTKRGILKKTVEEGMNADKEAKVEAGVLDPAAPQRIFEALHANFDALHGGWTRAPKFPLSAPIEASLSQFVRERDQRALDVAERALHALTDGPLFDRVGGGVHRLAASEDWSSPEYEKLLDRNVALLDTLLSAYAVTSKAEYADRAADIVRYLQSTLRRSGGGYFASQSSDPASPDGGAYYRASAEERARMKAPSASALVSVGWSAKAAAALIRAAYLLQRPELAAAGRETLDWLLATAYERGRGVVHGIDGEGKVLPAYLEDQVSFTEGMLEAYTLTGEKAFLRAAKDVAGFALGNLRDPKTGLFGDIIPDRKQGVPFQTALHPFEANCRMARVLAHLFYLHPTEKALRAGALGVLEAYASSYEKGPGSALYALATAEYREGPLWAWVVGNAEIPGTTGILAAVHGLPVLWKIVVTLDPSDGGDAEIMKQMGFVLKRPPAVYFSIGTHTSKPALLVREILPAYTALADFLVEEKTRAAQEAAREKQPEKGAAPAGSDPGGAGGKLLPPTAPEG